MMSSNNIHARNKQRRFRHRDAHAPGPRSGVGLVEVLISMPIVLVALGVLIQILSSGNGLRKLGREQWVAANATQTALERMRNEDFRDIAVLYNADPLDDPGGPGTAPGHRFAVEGLTAIELDGLVGEIRLPLWNAGSPVAPDWQIREDIDIPSLGTPRDLNGDSIIDDLSLIHI